MPKLSILLSAFSAKKYIREAIDSILNQTFRDFELIIADDGSNDDTKSIIDGYEDARIITSHNAKNCGKVDTINRLFKLSSGEYISVHDADDISKPNRFEIQLKEFDKNPSLIMCGTWFTYIKENGTPLFNCKPATSYEEVKKSIHCQSVFHGPTVIVKKGILLSLGQIFRPFFYDYNEDADLNMRISELGECYNINEFLYKYRVVPNSLSKSLTPRKMALYSVVAHLANQRIKRGKDDLQANKEDQVQLFLNEQLKIFERKKFLAQRMAIDKMMYFDLKKKAVKLAFELYISYPLDFDNLRLLQYCIRKWLIGR